MIDSKSITTENVEVSFKAIYSQKVSIWPGKGLVPWGKKPFLSNVGPDLQCHNTLITRPQWGKKWTDDISRFVFMRDQFWPSGPHLNIKTVLSTYGDFHVKDKTAARTSYL